MEAIQDSTVYAKKADGHLPELYYLVAWKGYPVEENTWEASLAVMHLRKMVSIFHKDYPEKPTATLAPLDSALLMAMPIIQLPAKRKRGRSIGRAKKRVEWGDKEEATRKRRQRRGNKEEATKRNLSQCGSRARSRRVAGDLSPWHGERCRGACMVVAMAVRLLKNYTAPYHPSPLSSKSLIIQVPYHPSPSSSKSLIIQVPYHPSPSSTKPRPSSLHQSRFFLPCP